jgi:hypothetical protein
MIAIVVFFACLYLRHGGNIEDMLIMMVLACPPLIQRIYPTQAGWFVWMGQSLWVIIALKLWLRM